MPEDGGDADATVAKITAAGVDIDALALKLQQDGAQAFVKSWHQLLGRLSDKVGSLGAAKA
jgi:transaldolase